MYLFNIYIDLNVGQTIDYSEIKNYSELMGITLKAWEVKAIIRMANAAREGFLDG